MNDQRQLPENFDWKAFTPDDSPRTPMDVLADPVHQNLATASVQPGAPAFGFRRPLFDFSTGRRVDAGGDFDLLEIAREKPVALIFGSYT